MSSMFKKKGGLAFKPKAPVARPRPSAPSVKPAQGLQQAEATSKRAPEPTVPETIEPELDSRELQLSKEGRTAATETPTEPEKVHPITPSRRSTRRASRSQPSDPSPRPRIEPEATVVTQESTEVALIIETAKADAHPPPPTPSKRTRRSSEVQPALKPSIETPEVITPLDAAPSSKSIDAVKESHSTSGSASEEPATASVPRGRPAATKPPAATVDVPPDAEQSRPKKRQRKAPKQSDDAAPATAPRRRKASSTPRAAGSRSSSRRARSLTPEDAESQTVDLQKLRMSDLTKDLRIGKKFSRHDELRDRERQARLKAKLEKDGNATDGTQSPAPEATVKSGTPNGSSTPTAAAAGPQFRIVDGQIIVDQSSLVMDRHARAAAAQAGEDMETIEENDFTRLITSSSFMNTSKLKGPNIWTDAETELFYRGLRMFGTDFEMLSKMFPGKQRRHIKLKYNREERHNPKRIDAAVVGEKTIKMDIDEYRAFTGAEFESVEAIEAEQRKIQESYEAERQRVADEQAEIMRKKREELFADEDGDENGDSKKKKKGGKKKGKQTISYGLNGEPIVEGS